VAGWIYAQWILALREAPGSKLLLDAGVEFRSPLLTEILRAQSITGQDKAQWLFGCLGASNDNLAPHRIREEHSDLP